MSNADDRCPPPPFRRTRYFAMEVQARPDRRDIDDALILQALAEPARRSRQPDGRFRHWLWVARRGKWFRVINEPDGETVHNAFRDRGFKP